MGPHQNYKILYKIHYQEIKMQSTEKENANYISDKTLEYVNNNKAIQCKNS